MAAALSVAKIILINKARLSFQAELQYFQSTNNTVTDCLSPFLYEMTLGGYR